MSTGAEYGIFRVRYNSDGDRIEKLEVAKADGDSYGPKWTLDQLVVVSEIESGSTFITVTSDGEKYRRGADVRIVKIGNNKFLRTDRNSTGQDNLGSLPSF